MVIQKQAKFASLAIKFLVNLNALNSTTKGRPTLGWAEHNMIVL